MKRRLAAELRHLFGAAVLQTAEQTDLAALELSAALVDAVHEAADALLAHRGDPAAQRAIVAGLPDPVRLLTCMWLLDTELAAKVIRAVDAAAARPHG
jgi:hypothetical protein